MPHPLLFKKKKNLINLLEYWIMHDLHFSKEIKKIEEEHWTIIRKLFRFV